MSVYTTKTITRSEAIRQILEERAKKGDLYGLSNDELADLMFTTFGSEYLPNSRLEDYKVIND